ncbi:photoreceptor cilium actin regulator [Rana temporaria]|uniref:photoreceptor cilium actin regulator n=1 Tax=Rana temporaria TaxID=8407 RepID=UPI001AAD85B8|nr:photoreceptor cilium actin regulator [Rana temporaria]
MGCSPSHNGIVKILAKNAAKPLKKNKSILPPEEQIDGITIPLGGEKFPSCHDLSDENKQKSGPIDSDHLERGFSDGPSRSGSLSEDQRKYEAHGTADEGMVNLTYQRRRSARKYSSTCSEQELSQDAQREGNPKRGKKSKSRKSGKHGRHAKQGQIVFPEPEKKVDFPELLVKAHQDAYAFLNPNLSKYEGIISMANQATQTQLIMQQMVSFMALRFDEINQCLGEIVEDGEKLLKDVGGNLTWPSAKDNLTEHPDLLQQLLQYTVNRMQAVNGTVASLSTNALQETCLLLQSAVDSFQEKLKKKEHHDERLLKMIKALEDSTTGSTQPRPNDMTLYSEDSGFGGDGESIRGYRSPGKTESRASIATSGCISLEKSEGTLSKGGSTNMDDSPKQVDTSRVSKQISITSNNSAGSLGTCATLEQESVLSQDPEDSSSSEDSYEESDDNKSLSSLITLPPRPLTSPAGTCAFRHSPKWVENPENEEMSLKMKEAISEKIKFVPGKSNSDVWTREEISPEPVRPSSADGSNRRAARHRRSRSAESLKSQGEDPTLLELQRTQKELTKKLEQLYLPNGTRNKKAPQNRSSRSFGHTGCISAASTNKLKACLDKRFNILPSQELIPIRKPNIDVAMYPNTNQDSHIKSTPLPKQDTKIIDNPTIVEQRLEGIISPRQSVRKLIQAFSPEDNPLKNLSRKTLGPLRCVRKVGVPVLPPTIPACKGLLDLDNISDNLSTVDENPSNSSPNIIEGLFMTSLGSSAAQELHRTYTNECGIEDPENLPPPPLEILMDDSFSSLQCDDPYRNNLPCLMRNASTASKIKTSMNIKDLLPNKNSTESFMPTFKTSGRKEPVTGLRKFSVPSDQHNRVKDPGLDPMWKNEFEDVAHLYRQSHKIIPLQNPGGGETLKSIPHIDSVEQSTLPKQKQCSPVLQRSEKSAATQRRTSPTRATASSPTKTTASSQTRATASSPTKTTASSQTRATASSPTKTTASSQTRATASSPTKTTASSPTRATASSPTRATASSPTRATASSPTRATASSPPIERKTASPPTGQAIIKTRSQVHPSPPPVQKSTSPSYSSRAPSPPNQSKLSSPPTLRKLTSPPQIRRQQSPPSHQRMPSPPQIQRQQSPPSHQRMPSPPQIRRQQSPPSHQRTPSPPQIRQQQSPPSQRRLPSPPQIRRQQSPPGQPRLPGPPQTQKQQSPPSQPRVASPPSSRREPSPPSHFTPSPPLSPSFTHGGLRRSSDESQASSKMFGNAQSIFCPSSSSLFETKPAPPPCTSSPETAPNQASVSVLKHNLSGRQYDDRRRSLATSAANPQPFVRRCFSDRRPRVQLRLPTSISTSALSEPALQQTGPDEAARKDGQSRTSPGLTDPKTSNQNSAPPGLCVVGQGLQ